MVPTPANMPIEVYALAIGGGIGLMTLSAVLWIRSFRAMKKPRQEKASVRRDREFTAILVGVFGALSAQHMLALSILTALFVIGFAGVFLGWLCRQAFLKMAPARNEVKPS